MSASARPFALSEAEVAFFDKNGFVGPFACLSEAECNELARHLSADARPGNGHDGRSVGGLARIRRGLKSRWRSGRYALLLSVRRIVRAQTPRGFGRHWIKSMHLRNARLAALGRQPAIVERMQDLLGEDLLLWGSEIVRKQGQSHRWHSDIEHLEWHGGTVWFALENVGADNTMKVVPGSHRYPFAAQDLVTDHGADLSDDASILAAVRRTDPAAAIVKIDIAPGEFFIFAGRTFHASHDVSDLMRSAVILQYCAPSQRVSIPQTFEPRERRFHHDQPWVMLVAGKDDHRVNHVVVPPELASHARGVASRAMGG